MLSLHIFIFLFTTITFDRRGTDIINCQRHKDWTCLHFRNKVHYEFTLLSVAVTQMGLRRQ